MCRHEIKQCARCGRSFECKMGTITQCQCFTIRLSGEQQAFLQKYYQDCLCATCLQLLPATKAFTDNKAKKEKDGGG
jgi:hypothetical protein